MTCRLSFDDGELRRGEMGATHLDQALEAMRRDGFVVLEQVVDHEPLDILKQRMDRDSRELLAFCETIGGNPRETGHLQQGCGRNEGNSRCLRSPNGTICALAAHGPSL